MGDYREDHKAMMDSLLLAMPGVKVGKAFGYPAYRVNGKIFVFVGGWGIALKLPAPRVQELANTALGMKPFEVVEGVVWREWLSIDRDDSADYAHDLPLLEESMGYVGGLA